MKKIRLTNAEVKSLEHAQTIITDIYKEDSPVIRKLLEQNKNGKN
jgi:hypothetical protein